MHAARWSPPVGTCTSMSIGSLIHKSAVVPEAMEPLGEIVFRMYNIVNTYIGLLAPHNREVGISGV